MGCVVFNNNSTGIYYGISGFKNPTRQDSVADWLQNRYDAEYPKWLENNDNSYCADYGLDNCGEFNAVNTALHNQASPENLSLYSVHIRKSIYMEPCENCQHLYIGITFLN